MGRATRRVACFWAPASVADMLAAGMQHTTSFTTKDFSLTWGISAVFVDQLNVFQGQTHKNADDFVWRYWDDGRPSMSEIGWEGHDEGDMSPNSATSALSAVGEVILDTC